MLFLPALWTATKAFFAFGLTANWCFRSVRTRFDLIEKIVEDVEDRSHDLDDISPLVVNSFDECKGSNLEHCFGECRNISECRRLEAQQKDLQEAGAKHDSEDNSEL